MIVRKSLQRFIRWSSISSICLGVQFLSSHASAQLLNENIQLSEKDSQTITWITYEIYSNGQFSIVDHFEFNPKQRSYDRSGLERDAKYYSKLLRRTEELLNTRGDIRQSACKLPYYEVEGENKSPSDSSCEELFAAALCRFSSKAGLKSEALEHCKNFTELFEKTLEKAKNADIFFYDNGFEVNPHLAAIRHGCIFGFSIDELQRDATLQHCLESYEIEKAKLPRIYDPNNPSSAPSVPITDITAYLNRIGFIYQEKGNHNNAIRLVTSYLEYLEPLDLGESFINDAYTDQGKVYALEVLGDIYMRAGQYSEAVESYEPILRDESLDGLIGLQEKEYRIQNKLASALLGDRQFPESEEEFRSVIEYQEEVGPNDLTYSISNALRVQETNRAAYDRLQALLIAQERYDEALEISDRRRSFLFSGRFRALDNERSANPNTRPVFTFEEMRDEARRRKSTFVVYAKSNLLLDLSRNNIYEGDGENEYINIWVVQPNGELTFQNVSVDSTFNASETNKRGGNNVWVSISKVVSIISVVSLCILFLQSREVSRKRVYAIGSAVSGLIFASTFFIFSPNVSDDSNIDNNISLLLQAVSQTTSATRGESVTDIFAKNTCSSSERCLKRMYQLLIEPIQADLPDKGEEKHITFVPDGELNSISFAALTSLEDKYLIDDYVISIVPSIRASSLLRLRAERKEIRAEEALVVGNPIMPDKPGDDFSEPEALLQLPYAEQEAKDIAKLLNTEPLIGAEATKENVTDRLTQSKYIHLATHGLPNVDTYHLPSFALTPSSGAETQEIEEDGFLDTNELYGTPLNGELAVLSACDTSSGQGTVEGNLSLARPFLTNGIPSVVASLWQVNDESTSRLMSYFYQNLESTENKALALRNAILSTKDEYPDPKDWAGFMLIGLSELPEAANRSANKQAVGTVSCSLKYYRGGVNSNSKNLTKAVLEKLSDGYQLKIIEEDGSTVFLELDSNLVVISGGVIEAGSDERVPYSLDTDESYNTSLEVSSDGSFEVGIISRRSSCSVKGRLEFLGSTKTELF